MDDTKKDDTKKDDTKKAKKAKKAQSRQSKEQLFANTAVTIDNLPKVTKAVGSFMRYDTAKLEQTIKVFEDRNKGAKMKFIGSEYALSNAREALKRKQAPSDGP